MSLNISLRSHRGQPEWRWTPRINFELRGKMSKSAAISVELTSPTGKQFVNLNCPNNGNPEDDWRAVEDCGNDLEADSSTNQTGVFGIQIKLTDELNGLNKVLYSGKFTVNKYVYNPAKQPQFAKNFYYYIDYDWRLPIAYVGAWKDEYTPKQLFIWVWVKGNFDDTYPKAYLFYKGKQIGEAAYGGDLSYNAEENEPLKFTRLHFKFNALFAKPESASYDSWWKFYENPGDYEIKILRKGELARTLKFSTNADANFIESGIGKEVTVGYGGIVVPVVLSGTTDGTLNQTILKSGWWGNPISGLMQ